MLVKDNFGCKFTQLQQLPQPLPTHEKSSWASITLQTMPSSSHRQLQLSRLILRGSEQDKEARQSTPSRKP